MTSRSLQSRGYNLALVSSLFLSTTAIFIRHLTLTYQMPALVLAVWREVFVALILLVVLAFIRPALLAVPRNQRRYLIGFGFLLACTNAFWTLSVSINGAAVSTVLVYSSAGFTVLLGRWLLKEDLNLARIGAVILCLGGCVFVSGAYRAEAWAGNLAGILTGLLSGLLYALYTLMGRNASQRGLDPWTTLLYTFAIAAVFLSGFILATSLFSGFARAPGAAARPADFFWLGDSWSGWGVLFLLAAVPTLAGYGLYMVSLSILPSGVTNLILTSETVFTAVFAFFVFGERLSAIQLIGSFLIIGGVVFLRLYESRMDRRAKLVEV